MPSGYEGGVRGGEGIEGGKKKALERKGASLGQLCWLLQALLTQQKDEGKGKKRQVQVPSLPFQLPVLVGFNIACSHKLASKGGLAVEKTSGSFQFSMILFNPDMTLAKKPSSGLTSAWHLDQALSRSQADGGKRPNSFSFR